MSNVERLVGTAPVPYSSTDRRTAKQVAQLVNKTGMELLNMEAITGLGEVAALKAARLKELQRALETDNVDAAEAIALVVNQTIINIARRLNRFERGLP